MASLLKNSTKQKHIKSLTELNTSSTTHATEVCQEILTKKSPFSQETLTKTLLSKKTLST